MLKASQGYSITGELIAVCSKIGGGWDRRFGTHVDLMWSKMQNSRENKTRGFSEIWLVCNPPILHSECFEGEFTGNTWEMSTLAHNPCCWEGSKLVFWTRGPFGEKNLPFSRSPEPFTVSKFSIFSHSYFSPTNAHRKKDKLYVFLCEGCLWMFQTTTTPVRIILAELCFCMCGQDKCHFLCGCRYWLFPGFQKPGRGMKGRPNHKIGKCFCK